MSSSFDDDSVSVREISRRVVDCNLTRSMGYRPVMSYMSAITLETVKRASSLALILTTLYAVPFLHREALALIISPNVL